MSCFTLNAADHTRGTGAIRGFDPCALDRPEGPEGIREPVINRSVVTTRFSMRSLNCDLTASEWSRQRSIPRKRQQLPETISAGTSLGSLRNRERQACSNRVRALVLAELPPSSATARSNLVNATRVGTGSSVSMILQVLNKNVLTSSHVQNILNSFSNAPTHGV